MLPRVFECSRKWIRRSTDAGRIGYRPDCRGRLVEMHEGSVSAFSEGLGKGSEFTIRFPIGARAGRDPIPPTESPRSKEGMRFWLSTTTWIPRQSVSLLSKAWMHDGNGV